MSAVQRGGNGFLLGFCSKVKKTPRRVLKKGIGPLPILEDALFSLGIRARPGADWDWTRYLLARLRSSAGFTFSGGRAGAADGAAEEKAPGCTRCSGVSGAVAGLWQRGQTIWPRRRQACEPAMSVPHAEQVSGDTVTLLCMAA